MDKAIAGRFAASMLEKGTKTKTRQQIKDEFDRLKARVWVYGNASQANVGIETTRENLPAVMKLVAEILKEPTFPEKEFAELRQEILTDLDDQRSQPQAIAYRKNQSIMSPYPKGDIRYSMTFDEEKAAIEALTLDEVKKFYKEFYGASDATLAVVGDFDENAIRKITKSEFGSWKSPKPFERLVTKYFDIAPVYESLETPDKTNAMFLASLNLPIRDDDPDYPALVLGNYMLGGGFLNSRLATRIRQQEGLSYGVGSNLWANSLDKAGSFSTYAIYAPENAEKLEQAFKEEIEKMRTEGFTAEEVKAAKSGYLQSRQVNRSQDNSLAGTLNNYLFIKRDMKWEADFEKKIADLSPEQISSAMRKHIDPAKLVFIKAGDFEGAKMKAGEGKDADKPAAGAAGSSQE
jgi:zinc protease